MIVSDHSLVLLIDLQKKLINAVSEGAEITAKAGRLLKACQLLRIPVVVTEQNPVGLGETVPSVSCVLPSGTVPYAKTSFSALSVDGLQEALQKIGRKQIIIGGVETHICVWQTARDLQKAGYDVWIVADMCASRHSEDKERALADLQANGCRVVGYESILFAWLKDARHPQFKAIQALIKGK